MAPGGVKPEAADVAAMIEKPGNDIVCKLVQSAANADWDVNAVVTRSALMLASLTNADEAHFFIDGFLPFLVFIHHMFPLKSKEVASGRECTDCPAFFEAVFDSEKFLGPAAD